VRCERGHCRSWPAGAPCTGETGLSRREHTGGDYDAFPDPWEAAESLGFCGRASGYSEIDAAVASIVLERIQDRLPNWAAVELAENDGEETVVHLARKVKPRQEDRITELLPRYLMMINWADSGPGYSWPVAYYVKSSSSLNSRSFQRVLCVSRAFFAHGLFLLSRSAFGHALLSVLLICHRGIGIRVFPY